MEKKKINQILGICIIILTIIGIIVIIKLNKKDKIIGIGEVYNFIEVFEIDEIEKTEYKIELNKNIEISGQYITGGNLYQLNCKVDLMGQMGKMIYVRESYNKLNVYQTEYEIDEYEAVSLQIDEIINDFEEKCKSNLNIDSEQVREELRGENTTKGKIPLGESIYNENRGYTKTYELEEKIYDINVYRKDDKIICELVMHLKQ